MQDLFKTTTFLSDNFFKPAIAYYFENQKNLELSIKELLININASYWPELEAICIKFLSDCKDLDFSDYILNQPNVRIGEKKGSEVNEEMIKNHSGEVKYLKSNAINAYVALFYLIKNNLDFVKNYNEIISRISKE
ncbi:MAG: hypothetical protein GY757_17580 [bacterium]|nr:hypothetical protein [bacterium]